MAAASTSGLYKFVSHYTHNISKAGAALLFMQQTCSMCQLCPCDDMLLTRADVQADEDVTTRLADRDRGRDVTLSDGPFPRSPQWASLSVCLPGRRAALTLANSWKCQPLPGFVGLNCCFLVATPWSELDATALTFPGPSHLRHPESKLI